MSLEHQNPSKTSEKWVILIALQFRYTFYRPQTKRPRARKIGLQDDDVPCASDDDDDDDDVPCASEDMACGY